MQFLQKLTFSFFHAFPYVLIKNMVAYHCPWDGPVVAPKIQGANRNIPAKHLPCRLPAACVRPGCQHGCKPAACHRRELPALVNDPGNCVREMGTADPIQDHAPNRQLPFVAFAPCFALDDCRKHR